MNNTEATPEAHVPTQRLEALTDATFAIIMTLLVLELRVPEEGSGGDLLLSLRHLLPSVVSFVISFVVLGVYWTAHHTQFRYIKRVDHTLIWLNIFYLLVLSFVPFSAAILGRHYTEQVSIVVYASNMIAATVVHFALWRYGTHKNRLTDPWVDGRLVGFGSQISYFSFVGYLLAIVVSFISVPASIVILTILPLPFVLGLFYRLLLKD
jgi:uncharacterized membrane protein